MSASTNEEETMPSFDEIAERYIASFNATDPEARRRLVDDLYTPDGGYTDPLRELNGRSEIEEFVATTQEHFPGYVFSLGSQVDGHHEQMRFNWHATPPGETEPEYVGFDVLLLEGGRVRRVYGFLDKVPAAV
jgi:SnoaL-like domain